MTDLAEIGLYLLYIAFPILVIYIAYLVFTKAFNDMGFSSFEAVIIVFVSFLFGFNIVISGFNISNIPLFTYGNWAVGINTGGALIPIILSIYLVIKKKIQLKNILFGILVVTIITYSVTRVVPEKGIISPFPYFLLPAIFASLASVFLSWKNHRVAAPLAYVSGTIGVLIGADFLHLYELLISPTDAVTPAIIGGANVFDMVFVTGVLAVIVDGVLMQRQKTKVKAS